MLLPTLLLAWSCLVAPAQQRSPWEQIGMLSANRTHAAWTSPESLVSDLRSEDWDVRLKAVRLLGIDAREEYFASAVPAEIELRVASLSGDRARQAIVLVTASSWAYAAVAVPSASGWERIAVFECWCKYEGSTLLDDFVRIEYTYHGRPDLVVRASGGGTGVYEQTEARFALQGSEERQVLSFISRSRTCLPWSVTCLYEHRWFRGEQLVEAKATFSVTKNVDWDLADARDFKSITCTAYKWDSASFTYTRSGGAHLCVRDSAK